MVDEEETGSLCKRFYSLFIVMVSFFFFFFFFFKMRLLVNIVTVSITRV